MRTGELISDRAEYDREIDLSALGRAIRRRRRTILLPTALAALAMAAYVTLATPRYTAESQVLLENQETVFTRPDRVTPMEQTAQMDQEGVASQVQLVQSPDIARRAIAKLHLIGNPEFDPSAHLDALSRILVLLGLKRDPTQDTVEARVTQAFLDKLTVFSPPKTRVITIQFSSKDPQLAARVANVVAELYIEEQSAAKRATAKQAADALAGQISDLRTRLATADAERERYRSQAGLLSGSNNLTITAQQLADLNGDLSKARAEQADEQAKAQMIRELLKAGKTADVPDVINNETVRRIAEQRSGAQAMLALESRSLLPEHPRVKALRAQVDEYDRALKAAARQAAVSLENQATIAGTRVANLRTMLGEQKKEVGSANFDEVHLRALERTTQSLKDQLESSMTKYQEAQAREESTATPADARVITRAHAPQDASFPKKLPFIAFATVAGLVLSTAYVAAGELMSAGPGEGGLPPRPRRAVPSDADDMRPRAPEPRAREDEPDLILPPVAEPARRTAAAAPMAPVRQAAAGRVATLLRYLKGFGRSAAETRILPPTREEAMAASDGVGWDPVAAPVPDAPQADPAEDVAPYVERIVASHVPGRGLHIVAATATVDEAATAPLLELSRLLSGRGRSVLVDLNRLPTNLAPLCEGDGLASIQTMDGLAELLAGESSFAEVIYRDVASRLHFIPAGLQEANFRDFDLILDALSETYDFVVMLTPPLSQSEVAKVMAPYADVLVVAATRGAAASMLADVETEMTKAGARKVMVIGGAAQDTAAAQDVA